MSTTYYRTTGDTGPPITVDLLSGGVGHNLSGETVVCYLRATDQTLAQTISTVTPGNQSTNPGRCTTALTGAQLVDGTYTVEWYSSTADLTFPAKRADRPFLVVRSAAA